VSLMRTGQSSQRLECYNARPAPAAPSPPRLLGFGPGARDPDSPKNRYRAFRNRYAVVIPLSRPWFYPIKPHAVTGDDESGRVLGNFLVIGVFCCFAKAKGKACSDALS